MDAWVTKDAKPFGVAWRSTSWRKTAFAKYVDRRIYDIERGYRTEVEELTSPWLSWNPSDSAEFNRAVKFVRNFESLGEHEEVPFLQSWEPFLPTHKFDLDIRGEEFRASDYFGDSEELREQHLSTVKKFIDQFKVDSGSPIPVSLTDRLRAIRDETKAYLQSHSERLNRRVMRPLRNILIPCAIEGAKVHGGLSAPRHSMDKETESKRNGMIHDLDLLWLSIKTGKPFQVIKESHQLEEALDHVPDPVAKGAKAAMRVYIESNEEKVDPHTRDDILERARPVYFKWKAACLMLNAALYDRSFAEAFEETATERKAREVFGRRPTLRSHAAGIIEKYRADPKSLPEKMGSFKEKWVPDSPNAKGVSKVGQLQRAIREAGISDRYSNPESFCDLLEQLVERYDTASS